MKIYSETARKRWYGPIQLSLLIGIVCACHLVWIWQDQAPFPFGDSYAYLTQPLKFVNDLDSYSLGDLWRALGDLGFNGRPPLYMLLTVPLVMLFGGSEDVATSLNVLLSVVLMLSVYRAAGIIKNEKAGLLAALLAASYPPIIQLTRMYVPHAAVPVCSALSLWLLLLLIKRRSIKIAWLFGMSLAFGLLVHPNFLWFWLGPPVVFGVYMLLFQSEPRAPDDIRGAFVWLLGKFRDRFVLLGLLPAAVVAVGFGSSWYLTRGLKLFELNRRMAAPELSTFRSGAFSGGADAGSVFWWYARESPAAISNILALFALMALVYGAFQRRAAAWVPVIATVAGYAFFASGVRTQTWQHFAGIFPFVAVMTAVWVVSIKRKWLSKVLVAVCILAAVAVFTLVTWGVRPRSQSLAVALGADLNSCPRRGSMALCLSPAEGGGSDLGPESMAERVLELILEDPKCRSDRGCRLFLVRNTAGLRPSQVNYYLARDWPGARLAVASEGVPTWGGFYDLHALLHSDYVLWSSSGPDRKRDLYQQASKGLLRSPPPSFAAAHQVVGSFEFAGGGKAELIRRRKSLAVDEAEASISALDLPVEYKLKKYLIMPPLYAAENRWSEALACYDEGLLEVSEMWPVMRSSLKSGRSRVLGEMGSYYVKEGQAALGLESLQEIVRQVPENKKNRLLLAQAYLSGSQTAKAAAELETVITLAPDEARPRRMLGKTYLTLGKFAEAIELYKEAIELEPTFAGGYVALALAYRQSDRAEDAIVELGRAIALAPDQARPRRILGDTYRARGSTAEAIELYEQALELQSSNVGVHISLALAYRQSDRKEDAVKLLEEALSLAPDQVRPRRILAEILESLEQTDRAIAIYQEILEIDATDELAQRALERMTGG